MKYVKLSNCCQFQSVKNQSHNNGVADAFSDGAATGKMGYFESEGAQT